MIYYVNAQASRDGNGSKEMPFRHIDDAARIAVAGDEILVAPGIYREYVNPRNAGTEDKRIVYRSVEPLGAVITGAETLTGWEKYEGDVWKAVVENGVFGAYNPYATMVCGDWYFAPTVRHTGAVFLNDRMIGSPARRTAKPPSTPTSRAKTLTGKKWKSRCGATASCPTRPASATSPSAASRSTKPPPPGPRPPRTRTA